jgi:hypothetical protein
VADLLTEVSRFRNWANAAHPLGRRYGEWECDYEDWGSLYEVALKFVTVRPYESWSTDEVWAVLYAIARDNEMQHLAGEIRRLKPDLLAPLTRASIEIGECEDRWQLAEELGQFGRVGGEEERLLLILSRDKHEYVRRRALQSLTRLGSPAVEEIALEAWHRSDPAQQWSRMNALWCLRRISSPHLDRLLSEAEKDSGEFLREFAGRVLRGDVDM